MSSGPTCPKCGRINRPGVKFCATCGTSLVGVPQQPSTLPPPPQAPARPASPQSPPRPIPVAQPAARRGFPIKPLYLAIAAAAAIGVLLCATLFILFGSNLGIGSPPPTTVANVVPSATALVALATSPSEPTNTREPDTATPVIIKETVIVIATTVPSDTPTPTFTFTPSPEPTLTPFPQTATQIPPTATRRPPPPTNTPPDTVLLAGQAWNQDGMTMIIPSYNIAPTCPNVSLEFPVELRNITNEPRNVNFSTADIKLEDDRQTVYAIEFRLGLPTPSCDGFVPLLEQPGLAPNVPYQFTVRTSSKIPDDATEMIFTVNKAGRIHNARWKFPITR